MGTVASYITALVHTHDCVIVPGLGAFVGNFKPSEVVPEKGLFLPPKKEIGFNRSLQHNDGLLCDYIARCEGITFGAAQAKTEEFVSQTLSALGTKQMVVVDEIGELKKDAMGNILFWPNNSALFLPESFGLAPFHLNVSQQSAIYHHQKLNSGTSTVWLHRISQRKWVAGLALFAGLFLLNNELKTPDSVSTGSMVPQMTMSSTEFAPAEKTESPTVVDTISVTANIEKETASNKVVQPTVSEPTIGFYVVAASFPSLSAAEKHKDLMLKNGYSNSQVVSINGKNRVTIERFSSKEQANAALSNFRQIKGFENAWLLKGN